MITNSAIQSRSGKEKKSGMYEERKEREELAASRLVKNHPPFSEKSGVRGEGRKKMTGGRKRVRRDVSSCKELAKTKLVGRRGAASSKRKPWTIRHYKELTHKAMKS